MGRRTILLITSILIAAVGTALVAVYVRTADTRAQQDQTLTPVLVATAQIPAGTSGAQATVDVRQVPAALLHGLSYVTDRQQISDKVAQGLIYAGTPIQASMFGTTTPSTSLIGLDKNKVGVTIQVSDPGRVAGFAREGSDVAIYSHQRRAGGQEQSIHLLLLPGPGHHRGRAGPRPERPEAQLQPARYRTCRRPWSPSDWIPTTRAKVILASQTVAAVPRAARTETNHRP